MAYHWDAYGPPLRPSPPDIGAIERSVRSWQDEHGPGGPRVLMLGVTPEIAGMAWPTGTMLTAIDRSEPMLRHVWLGDVAGRRRAYRGDWFETEFGQCDVVVGDGIFAILRYPDQYRSLVRKIATSLTDGGLFITRPFLQIAQREAKETVLRDLLEHRIGTIHAFKLRLAMAMQSRAEDGARHGDVFDAVCRAGIDCDTLGARMGWTEREVDTLRIYEGKDARLSFPTAAQMAELMAAHFTTIDDVHFDYELSERCPVITYRRR